MWKHGKRRVYSITYDEGCQNLLEQRFATVRRLGGDEVWLAEPNDVVERLRTR